MARPISFDPEDALQRAMDLFWMKGSHSTSVEDIVQSTGLNRHSLYARYGNKQGLLEASLDHYRETVTERIRSIFEGPGTVLERLGELLRLRSPDPEDTLWYDISVRGCFALRMASEMREGERDPESDAFDDFLQSLEVSLTDLIRKGQVAGEIRNDLDAEDLAGIVLGGFTLPLLKADASRRLEGVLTVLEPRTQPSALQDMPR